jgi:glycosyltransferase involved in cell wall biosynthesis
MKKVLFYSYYWPPSGKASLHLPLKIIKYLPLFDWMPTVVTINEDTFSFKDESLLKEVSPDLRVIKTKAYAPFNLYKNFLGKNKNTPLIPSETISKENRSLRHRLAVWIRMNLFIPDARVGWYPACVSKTKKIIKQEKYDAIVSVGPPHSTHLIAKRISKKFNIPFIPVFIDPWVDIVYYKGFKRNKLTLALDNYFEKSVLNNASQVIFVTRSMLEDYQKKYSFLLNKSNIIYWGYNEQDFKDVKKISDGNNVKTILHAGNIFDYQNPIGFFKKIKSEIDKGNFFRLKFIGTVSPGIKTTLENIGLIPYTEYLGFLPYQEVVRQMVNADYLMMCASEKRHIPGKMFEYLRTGNPIIAFGEDNKEVETILTETNAGIFFPYISNEEIFFDDIGSFKTDLNKVKKYDRLNLTKEFSKILNSCVEQ